MTETGIHPTAVIEDGARIGQGCRIGAFCTVGAQVALGDRVELKSHVVVTGDTQIGEDSQIYQFAVVGEIPQDLKFRGEDTRLVIGRRNRIREHVTVNCGTEGGGGITRIGDDCLLMAGVHVAHDVQIGNRVILVNNVGIAGHAVIGDEVIVGGLSGVHQWVRIGRGAIIGALTKVTNDVIPYGQVDAGHGTLQGLNLIGLRRRGLPREDIAALRAAYRDLAEGQGTFQERARKLREIATSDHVREIVDFILAASDRSFLTPRV